MTSPINYQFLRTSHVFKNIHFLLMSLDIRAYLLHTSYLKIQ